RLAIRSGWESQFVFRRIVRVANHVRISHRKIDIDLDGSADEAIENSDRRRARSPDRPRLGQMATGQSSRLLLCRSHAGRGAEVVLVTASSPPLPTRYLNTEMFGLR